MSPHTHSVDAEELNVSLQESGQTEQNVNTIIPAWLIKLCRPSRMIWLAPLLGFILSIPSFFTGYNMDDHVFRQYGRPLSVEFTFKNDMSQYTWLKWENKKPQKCELPPVGEEVVLFASLF